ncbi:hypothetical protein IJJ27_02080 [bacterium]|nr:hypothetical protein [bacterium]
MAKGFEKVLAGCNRIICFASLGSKDEKVTSHVAEALEGLREMGYSDEALVVLQHGASELEAKQAGFLEWRKFAEALKQAAILKSTQS